MLKRHSSLSLVAVGALLGMPALFGQNAAGQEPQAEAPRVFLDCQGPQCDDTYHRTEIPWVTWVRDQQDADLHVIMTSQATATNGREYLLDATGREAYADYRDESIYQTLSTDTQRERIDGVSHALGLTFARFAQYAGFRSLVTLQASQDGREVRSAGLVSAEQVDDPWNLWAFRLNTNGNFNGEETRVTRRFSGGLNVSRVTPTWKQNYEASMNYNYQSTTYSSGSSFIDRRTDWNFNSTIVYAMAEFWSVGFTSRVGRNVRENQHFSATINPAIEYSIFPYDEATRQSMTFFYEIGPTYFDYIEVTVDERLKETRFQQALTLGVSQRQTWGNVRVNVRGSHYLHDWARNNLNMSGNVSFRITRGLNLNFGGNYTLVADQLYLPLEGLSDEELLAGVRQAPTDKRYGLFVGLSYQFGSIFNNIVNNRFLRGGGNFGGGRGGFRNFN
jgi:hypothetical protein